MLPVSIAMFIASASALGCRAGSRCARIVRTGLCAHAWPPRGAARHDRAELDESAFALGDGRCSASAWGLLASQLGNVVQSSVDASGRGEAGGLQFTGQQLGSSLGVALIGAIVLSGLTSASSTNVADDDRISAEVSTQVGVAAGTGIDFVTVGPDRSRGRRGRRSTRRRPRPSSTTTSRRRSRRSRPDCSAAALLALVSLAFTRDLPHGPETLARKPEEESADA